jgi:hypothetical protein
MVLSVARPKTQDSQVHILQYQMQQCLDKLNIGRFEVRIGGIRGQRSLGTPSDFKTSDFKTSELSRLSESPVGEIAVEKLEVGEPKDLKVLEALEALGDLEELGEISAVLCVLEHTTPVSEPTIRWVLDIAKSRALTRSVGSTGCTSELFYERNQLCARLAIADYWLLLPDQSALRTYHTPSASRYQQQRLWHVGEQASPTTIPAMTLRIQEPLPLHFLTRTLKGQRTYSISALPLQVCSTMSEL